MMSVLEIVLASGNVAKLRELRELLVGAPVRLRPQSDFGVASAPETGLSFVENALLKARHAAAIAERPALADDSGLAVDGLAGAPGIYSARYAGATASDADNVNKLLANARMLAAGERGCRFVCAMVFLAHARDPVPLICEAQWRGRLANMPRGEHGFGYDPVFEIAALGRTAAELTVAEKHRLSHRAQAATKMIACLREHLRDF